MWILIGKIYLAWKKIFKLIDYEKKIKEKYSNGTLKTLKTYFYKHNIRDNDACQGREFWQTTSAFIEEMWLFLKVRF